MRTKEEVKDALAEKMGFYDGQKLIDGKKKLVPVPRRRSYNKQESPCSFRPRLILGNNLSQAFKDALYDAVGSDRNARRYLSGEMRLEDVKDNHEELQRMGDRALAGIVL